MLNILIIQVTHLFNGEKGEPGRDTGGAVYIRWGRTVCPNVTGTELVYEGIAAGNWYSHTGGGSNYLCLQKVPSIRPFYQEDRVRPFSMEWSIKQVDHYLGMYTNTMPPVLSAAPLDPSTSCYQGKILAQQTGQWSTPGILWQTGIITRKRSLNA